MAFKKKARWALGLNPEVLDMTKGQDQSFELGRCTKGK